MANKIEKGGSLPTPQVKATEMQIGGSYLKPGQLKRAWSGPIDGRPVRENVPAGPFAGRPFAGSTEITTVDIPVSPGNSPHIASVNLKSQDYANMVALWGSDPQGWIGKTIQISDDPDLNRLRFQPVG